MPQLEPAQSPPHRSVRELVSFWEGRVAAESQPPPTKLKTVTKTAIDVFEPVARCRYCQQPRQIPVVKLAPLKSSQDEASGRLAQAGKDEAKLRLNRLMEPFAWGRKGNRRGK